MRIIKNFFNFVYKKTTPYSDKGNFGLFLILTFSPYSFILTYVTLKYSLFILIPGLIATTTFIALTFFYGKNPASPKPPEPIYMNHIKKLRAKDFK
jgi:hypothetical protein